MAFTALRIASTPATTTLSITLAVGVKPAERLAFGMEATVATLIQCYSVLRRGSDLPVGCYPNFVHLFITFYHAISVVTPVRPSQDLDEADRPTSLTSVHLHCRRKQSYQCYQISHRVKLTQENFQMTRSVARFLCDSGAESYSIKARKTQECVPNPLDLYAGRCVRPTAAGEYKNNAT